MTTTLTSTASIVREDDVQQHIEDDLMVNAIRDGKIVQVRYNELTEDERRAAEVALFGIYG